MQKPDTLSPKGTAAATRSPDDLMAENIRLREILAKNPQLYHAFYLDDCVKALKATTMFSLVPEKYLLKMAEKAERKTFPKGAFLADEFAEVENAYIIAEGEVRRWANIEGRKQHVSTYCDRSVGTLHLYNADSKSRFNAECETDVVAYVVKKGDIDLIISSYPEMSTYIIRSLSYQLRISSKKFVTPLLEQKGHKTTFTATTLAACVEAFFRSGMNSLINQKLSGVKSDAFRNPTVAKVVHELFPNMHVQVPVRVLYLNGMKQIRSMLDGVNTADSPFPTVTRMLLSFVPGVAMCPFSSVLEAANVTSNPTPLYRRWLIGVVPRLAREVIFGVGMNQLADYCTSRMRFIENDFARHATGSITAGWIAGYFSTVPHSLSALKLIHPEKSYRDIWPILVQRSKHSVPEFIPKNTALHAATMQTFAFLFPTGMVRRSGQIAGTFLIVNGFTYSTRNKDWY